MDRGKIEKFIERGEIIKKEEYHGDISEGLAMSPYIAGNQYDLWIKEIKFFTVQELQNNPIYGDIIEACDRYKTMSGTEAYDAIMNSLKATLEDLSSQKPDLSLNSQTKEKVIFISHAEKDIEYIKPFVSLLEKIGFQGSNKLFCSSVSGYDIPTGENIYDYLKTKLNQDVHVIMFLSENYYMSSACMNEMGATWIGSKKHTVILLPNFKYSNIKGAIDANKVWFKMDDRNRVNDLKDDLIADFGFPNSNNNIWESARDEYLETINSLSEADKYKNKLQRVDIENVIDEGADIVKIIFRFINDGNSLKVCQYIKGNIIDLNDNTAYFELNYDILKSYRIYEMERKRIIIELPKVLFDVNSSFDFNKMKRWTIEYNWTTPIE